MIIKQRTRLAILTVALILLAACNGAIAEPSIAQAPAPEVFVFPGPTEEILISTEDIPQNNCDGSAEKSDTVEKSHTVLRTLELGTGITVDASGQAGIPGVGQVGVGVAVANHYNVSYGSQDTVTRSTRVAAAAGTNILHTIRQYEIWETGELLVSAGGVNEKVSYRFRKDFGMETLPPANLGCPGQDVQPLPPTVAPDTGTVEPQPTPLQPEVTATLSLPPTTAPPTEAVLPDCPFLTNSHIEQLRTTASVSDALRQAEEFAGRRQNDYNEGSTIPTGVVIATDLQNSDLSAFPVSPIRNEGGWGLFVTTSAFAAPNDGTYWCIR